MKIQLPAVRFLEEDRQAKHGEGKWPKPVGSEFEVGVVKVTFAVKGNKPWNMITCPTSMAMLGRVTFYIIYTF